MSIANQRVVTTSEAIAEAIGQAMEADPRVLVMGEDVGRYGGVFGATEGLLARFGEQRVRDMPISEMAFTGMGVGLAMAGYRPLVEIMFADFVGVCLEQIFNAMAKIPYMSGGRVRMPMVVKTAAGSIGSAAQHSQCLWGTFAHLPGMRVVLPATPYDAKGLMTTALTTDDPVVFIEHKALMRRKSDAFRAGQPVPEERYAIPFGQAAIVRPGRDATLVAVSKGVEDSLVAAEALAAEGIEAEVIDLRTIVPLDMDTVASSVARTRRLLVIDEDYLSFGLSGEVVARTIERLGLRGLDAVARHAMPDIPLPAARTLEAAVLPGAESIAAAARKLMG
jgi:pyruvate dehydrogenase E1 component beta subunit